MSFTPEPDDTPERSIRHAFGMWSGEFAASRQDNDDIDAECEWSIATLRREAIDAYLASPGADDVADGVRYAGGNGTSDYWRGFNDGIDKFLAALRDLRGAK